MSDVRAAKHAETDAQKRAFQEALEQAQEADRIAKLVRYGWTGGSGDLAA